MVLKLLMGPRAAFLQVSSQNTSIEFERKEKTRKMERKGWEFTGGQLELKVRNKKVSKEIS